MVYQTQWSMELKTALLRSPGRLYVIKLHTDVSADLESVFESVFQQIFDLIKHQMDTVREVQGAELKVLTRLPDLT